MTLDAAWAAAEAELPDGWEILSLRYLDGQWRAEAGSVVAAWRYRHATGSTPVVALLALAGVLEDER